MNGWFANSGRKGQLQGYELDQIRVDYTLRLFPRGIYEFTLNDDHPLTYITPSGLRYQPDKHFETDRGSIPAPFTPIFSRDEFIAYLLHDAGYLHHGLYVAEHGSNDFFFVEMTRAAIDRLCLIDMIRAEGGGIIKSRLIYTAVRAAGWHPWRNGKAPEDA